MGNTVDSLTASYTAVKSIHVACVALSGGLFACRGALMLTGSELANHRLLARLSMGIDTLLLLAAILLTRIIRQYPFTDAWLTTKVLLLVLYIALGILALRRGRTRKVRAACFAAALTVFVHLIGVAVRHDPRGWLLCL